MQFTGRLGPIDGGWDITLFGAASGVVFALAAQIGEKVDFLRFLPRAEVAGRARWWISLIAAGPGWIVIGAAKMLAGSFLAYLAFKHGVPPDAAADPTQMYLVAFGYVVHDDTLALGLATIFVIVSQLKINITNSYAGSIAWSNFFSRLTHSHPGRVVWLVFNIVIAVVLIELGIYRAIEGILGFYAHVAVAWIGALFADLALNKPLGLSPKGIEFKRAYLYEINPVGFGATLFASLVSIAAHFGAFGEILRAMSCYLALVAALAAAPLIALATRGRFYIARQDDPPAMAEPQKCCICEHEFEPQDMAACPAYAGPICSLCCTLDARCHDSCKVDARFADQLKSAFSRFVPEGVIAMLGSNSGRYIAIFTLIICLLGGALSLVYWQAVLDARISPSLIGPPLAKAFVILSVISGNHRLVLRARPGKQGRGARGDTTPDDAADAGDRGASKHGPRLAKGQGSRRSRQYRQEPLRGRPQSRVSHASQRHSRLCSIARATAQVEPLRSERSAHHSAARRSIWRASSTVFSTLRK